MSICKQILKDVVEELAPSGFAIIWEQLCLNFHLWGYQTDLQSAQWLLRLTDIQGPYLGTSSRG